MPTLNLLHTSDWHIGQNLFGRKRYDESKAFLDWLLTLIPQQQIHVLLVAGDVFDSGMPSNRAQKLYYDFLVDMARTDCRHVVITGGNHDSPTFLNAPAGLLRRLHVHVLGQAASPAEEVLSLCNHAGEPEILVCAVPYLRERDIRLSEAGETLEDMETQRALGIRRHYDTVLAAAREARVASPDIPLVVMGHLFTVGGAVAEGDGVRELYVGSLGGVGADIFPPDADYVALGHLHSPQQVDNNPTRRYSGAPLAMSFAEAQARKSVVLARFAGRDPQVELVDVPVFQELVRLEGDWDNLCAGLEGLKARDATALVDLIYSGQTPLPDLAARVEALVQGSRLDMVRVRNNQFIAAALQRADSAESLQDMSVEAVFERCLDQNAVPEERRVDLRRTYAEALISLHEQDSRAE